MVGQKDINKMTNILNGWIMQAWRKEDADHRVIQLQKYGIGFLFILCAMLFLGWMTSPSRITVYIPPDIQNGATMKVGTIPSPLIYSFAYQVCKK